MDCGLLKAQNPWENTLWLSQNKILTLSSILVDILEIKLKGFEIIEQDKLLPSKDNFLNSFQECIYLCQQYCNIISLHTLLNYLVWSQYENILFVL